MVTIRACSCVQETDVSDTSLTDTIPPVQSTTKEKFSPPGMTHNTASCEKLTASRNILVTRKVVLFSIYRLLTTKIPSSDAQLNMSESHPSRYRQLLPRPMHGGPSGPPPPRTAVPKRSIVKVACDACRQHKAKVSIQTVQPS